MGVITERERQKYFAYLDGVADGLNESRNDVNSVLDKIRVEIKAMFPPSGSWMYEEGHEVEHTVCEVLSDVLQIIDKYKAESEG